MRDARIDQVICAIEARYPGTIVVTRPCPDPDVRDIECMVDVLNAPKDPPNAVEFFALERADRVFGDDPIPFLVGAYSPEDSRRYFAADLQRSRAARP
jgi:hypothetical protein